MEKELTFLLSLDFWWTICLDIFYVSTSFIYSVCLSVDTDKEQLTHQRKRERLRRLQSVSEALLSLSGAVTELTQSRAEVIKRTLYGAITDIMTWDTPTHHLPPQPDR